MFFTCTSAMPRPDETWMFTVTECLDILTFEKLLSTCTSANLAWRNPLRERQGWLRAWLAEYRRSVTQRRRLRALAQSVFPLLESFRSRCGDITFITELLDEALNLLMPALHVEWVAAGLAEPMEILECDGDTSMRYQICPAA